MIATIELEQIKIYAHHGCYAEEQVVGNNFTVDVTLKVDATKAAQTDNIADALNYVEVAQIVKEEMMQTSHLLENVVARICSRIASSFGAYGLIGGIVRVAKMNPPVGIEMKCVALSVEITVK